MPSSHLILCRPLLLQPPIPPSIRVFSNESSLRMRWPKYWSFSFIISPSNEHPGLIFRMDWLNLPAVQGTLKSLLQHHSSKASILRCSAFFTVKFSHPYMTTGKTIALTRWTLVGKVISLLFNMLSRLVIIVSLGWINAKKLSDFPVFILALIFQDFLYSDQQTKDLKKKSPSTFPSNTLSTHLLRSLHPSLPKFLSDLRPVYLSAFSGATVSLGPEICSRGLA